MKRCDLSGLMEIKACRSMHILLSGFFIHLFTTKTYKEEGLITRCDLMDWSGYVVANHVEMSIRMTKALTKGLRDIKCVWYSMG